MLFGFVAPAHATNIWHERHCKTVTVGLFDNNAVTLCVRTTHVPQADGTGIKILEEKMTFTEGCQFLVDGRKGSPARWVYGFTEVTSIRDLGPLKTCINNRFVVMSGPNRGPMDVAVHVKTQTNSGVGEEWINFAFKLERRNDG